MSFDEKHWYLKGASYVFIARWWSDKSMDKLFNWKLGTTIIGVFNSIFFIYKFKGMMDVLIHYSLEPHYNNGWMEKYFPSRFILIFLLIIFLFNGVHLYTLIWAKRIIKAIIANAKASDKIANQTLKIGSSNIKGI